MQPDQSIKAGLPLPVTATPTRAPLASFLVGLPPRIMTAEELCAWRLSHHVTSIQALFSTFTFLISSELVFIIARVGWRNRAAATDLLRCVVVKSLESMGRKANGSIRVLSAHMFEKVWGIKV